MTLRPLSLSLLLLGASLAACAQAPDPAATQAAADADADGTALPPAPGEPEVAPGTPEARARDAIRGINNQLVIDRIGAAPMPGFREVIVDGKVVYVSDDGRYLVQGSVIDLERQLDMGQVALAGLRRELLAGVPQADRIVFAPAEPVHTVTVFTDVECGYCRRFHQDIAELNRRGIAVEYLAFPRMGPGSEDFEKMVSVWCAPDRRKALTDAKADRAVPDRECSNPVAAHYALGRKAGLTGTPMILAEDGTQLGGYVPPDELVERLDQLAAQSAPAAAPPPTDAAPAAGDAGNR
jgi:thiol:disulfide interchange protein DsbC